MNILSEIGYEVILNMGFPQLINYTVTLLQTCSLTVRSEYFEWNWILSHFEHGVPTIN